MYTVCVALTAVLAACGDGSEETGAATDGAQILLDDGTITIDGLGAQAISTITIIDPVASGGVVSYIVSSADLSEERYFLYDRVQNYVVFGDFTRGAR